MNPKGAPATKKMTKSGRKLKKNKTNWIEDQSTETRTRRKNLKDEQTIRANYRF